MSKPTTGWKAGRKTINGHEYVLDDYYSWGGTSWVVRSGCGDYRLPTTFYRRADACNAAQAHAEAGGWPLPKPKPIYRVTYDVYADGEPVALYYLHMGMHFIYEDHMLRRFYDCDENGYPTDHSTIVQPVRLERVK